MGGFVVIEVKPGVSFTPIEADFAHVPFMHLEADFASGSVASLLISLDLYCSFRNYVGPKEKQEYLDKVLVDWFSAIDVKMTEDLCLLTRAIWGFWYYAEDEYERYIQDSKASPYMNPPDGRIKSREEFIAICKRADAAWTSTDQLLTVVNDFVRVLEELHPPDMWPYTEEDTLPDLQTLSRALALALKEGYEKVRFMLEN
jgi:hypothetical protein